LLLLEERDVGFTPSRRSDNVTKGLTLCHILLVGFSLDETRDRCEGAARLPRGRFLDLAHARFRCLGTGESGIKLRLQAAVAQLGIRHHAGIARLRCRLGFARIDYATQDAERLGRQLPIARNLHLDSRQVLFQRAESRRCHFVGRSVERAEAVVVAHLPIVGADLSL